MSRLVGVRCIAKNAMTTRHNLKADGLRPIALSLAALFLVACPGKHSHAVKDGGAMSGGTNGSGGGAGAKPAVPTGQSASVTVQNDVTVLDAKWIDNSIDETGFNIATMSSTGSYTNQTVADANTTEKSTVVYGLTNDTEQFYISAYNPYGQSPWVKLGEPTSVPPPSQVKLSTTSTSSFSGSVFATGVCSYYRSRNNVVANSDEFKIGRRDDWYVHIDYSFPQTDDTGHYLRSRVLSYNGFGRLKHGNDRYEGNLEYTVADGNPGRVSVAFTPYAPDTYLPAGRNVLLDSEPLSNTSLSWSEP